MYHFKQLQCFEVKKKKKKSHNKSLSLISHKISMRFFIFKTRCASLLQLRPAHFHVKVFFFLWSILSSSVVIASKNCYHTEQAVLWKDNQSAFQKADSSDEIVTEQSTFMKTSSAQLSVSASQKHLEDILGRKKHTNRDQAKKILKFELLKKKKLR